MILLKSKIEKKECWFAFQYLQIVFLSLIFFSFLGGRFFFILITVVFFSVFS